MSAFSVAPMRMSIETSNVGAGKTTVVAGATGYIGKSVVRESIRQGYNTVALVRDKSKVESSEGKMLYGSYFEGAKIVECDVCDPVKLTEVSLVQRNGMERIWTRCAVCDWSVFASPSGFVVGATQYIGPATFCLFVCSDGGGGVFVVSLIHVLFLIFLFYPSFFHFPRLVPPTNTNTNRLSRHCQKSNRLMASCRV